jgi:hypothetical protein
VSVAAIVARDLIVATRIAALAEASGHEVVRVDEPRDLPAAGSVMAVFVDWGDRAAGWGDAIRRWKDVEGSHPPRVVLFGPHSDLAAHADAAAHRIGPMIARSRLPGVARAIFVDGNA